MKNETIAGIILLTLGLLLLILFILSKVKNIIKSKKLKYKETTGIVIKSINTSDIKYQNKKNEDFFDKHKNSKTIYEFLIRLFPTSIENDKSKGSLYASVIQYEVNNKKYEIISDYSSDKKEKKKTKYKIKYNPSNPHESFIVNDRGKIIIFIFIVVLLGFGLKLLCFYWI